MKDAEVDVLRVKVVVGLSLELIRRWNLERELLDDKDHAGRVSWATGAGAGRPTRVAASIRVWAGRPVSVAHLIAVNGNG